MRINTALILCAGFGKRLNPLTLDTPKPLIKLNNITVLETCINLIESLGINKIFINTFYLKDQIHNFINKKNFKSKHMQSLASCNPLSLTVKYASLQCHDFDRDLQT